jgi:hypothetical protein
MLSNRRLDFHIPVAVPEADRDVSPKLGFGLHHARRSAQRITAAAAATSGSGRIHQMWPDYQMRSAITTRDA